MMLPPDPDRPAYDEPRGMCPSCGSDEVIHLVVGLPADPDSMEEDPDWVRWIGCPYPGYDRTCAQCGATWSWPTAERPTTVRLLSEAGAAFALRPMPSPLYGPSRVRDHVVDIELLTPDRLVRYLGRHLSGRTLAQLAEAWQQAAQDPRPEQTVATVQDDAAGLAVVVIESTPFQVTLEVLVTTDLASEVPEQDGIALDVPRTALIDAAHRIGGW